MSPQAMDSVHLNRGLVRLCTVTHMRALVRRRTLSNGLRAGIAHFMLVPPRRWVGNLKPGSTIAQHLWRVRTRQEWEQVIAQQNEKRRAVSTLDLGFHHNDPTHLVPIAGVHMAEAIAWGQEQRRKHLPQEASNGARS